MSRVRRWLHLRTRRSERGVTFVELVISVVILTMITGGLASAFITSLNSSGPTQERVKESNDAQVVASFLMRDAQATGGTDPSTGEADPSLGVSTSETRGCGAPTDPLVIGFKWIDRESLTKSYTHVANYFLVPPSRLVRTTCVGTGPASALTLATHVHIGSCKAGCAGIPAAVTVEITSTYS